MEIKQPVLNTFKKVGIDYTEFENKPEVEVYNRFGFGKCTTSALVARCIEAVYKISNDYEEGIFKVKTSDFDRLRYFILKEDSNAYMTCID